MKMIILYKCEICGYMSRNKKEVEKCELRGYGKEYPIGCIYGNHSENSFYKDITFAVAKNRTKKSHFNFGYSWACRDNGAGDSIGKNMCGGGGLYLSKSNGKLNFNHPTFKRMVMFLKYKNIPITIWDGEKAVKFDENEIK